VRAQNTVLRAALPKEDLVFDPKACMEKLVRHTHCKPNAWVGNEHSWKVSDPHTFHSPAVVFFSFSRPNILCADHLISLLQQTRDDLCNMYEYRLSIFLREVLSIAALPFVLFFSLGSMPRCSE